MLTKLIALADKLDKENHVEAADFVDNLILKLADDKPFPEGGPGWEEWEKNDPTKTDMTPLAPLNELMEEQQEKLYNTHKQDRRKSDKPTLTPLVPEQEVTDSQTLIAELNAVLTSFPNPEDWDGPAKKRVKELATQLAKVL